MVQTATVETLRSEIEFLREELRRREERHAEEARRKDHLLAAALERIPSIEPPPDTPSEPRESDLSASEGSDKGGVPREGERRSWWRRLFSG